MNIVRGRNIVCNMHLTDNIPYQSNSVINANYLGTKIFTIFNKLPLFFYKNLMCTIDIKP